MKKLIILPLLFLFGNVGISNAITDSEYNCVEFTSSCGETGIMCIHESDSINDVIADAEFFDEYLCG